MRKLTPFALSILEEVRSTAVSDTGHPDDPANFYSRALDFGASDDDAEAIDEHIYERIMRSAGMI